MIAPPTNAAPAIAGFFSGTNGLDATNKYPFFPSGFIGDLQVDATKGIVRRNGEKAFLVEFTVISSNLPEVYVGGKYTWFQSLKEPGTSWPSCIAFLYACLGLDSNRDKAEIDAKVKPHQDHYLNTACAQNALAGAKVRLQTAVKKTKAGGDFTLHTFSPAAKAD